MYLYQRSFTLNCRIAWLTLRSQTAQTVAVALSTTMLPALKLPASGPNCNVVFMLDVPVAKSHWSKQVVFRMFRSNWDLVSPFSWLDSLADEEEFMGRGDDYPSTHLFIFPRSERQREDESMAGTATQEQEDEEEEMETDDSPTAEEQKLMNFFDDLPVGAKLMDTLVPSNLSPPQTKTKDGYSFFTYAYSTCLTADDNGRRVNSTRRRYEDSAGRLKAQHKRQIGTCALESTWKRASEQDEGTHEHKVSSGSVENFEQAWKHTPFGVAEEQAKAHGAKTQSVLPDQPPAQELP